MKRSPELGAAEQPDSTRHVALARLPERLRRLGPPVLRPVIDTRDFQDGEVIPGTRYRVLRLIGAGGMGQVYEVEHTELGKRFVLKSLLRELLRREDLVARLRNEWRALARLEHPNIVNVTDAGASDNGVPFYVMERLDGETLASLMRRRQRLHPEQALGIAAGILQGLHAAHQIGVVHRDVKPPNIFLIGAAAVKILDFGIAKIRDAKDVITARGIAVGTPRYMSPEQAQGTPVDARSDIYAVGVMLFEMVSGVGPFDDARDNNELLLAHLGRKAPLLSSISVVAPELDALVARMLAKDPRERPGDARSVAEALRALSQRYAGFPATDAPTLNAPPAPAEVPTRADGPRRSSPAPAVTRPDGVAARGVAGDTTTAQPAFEIATTQANALPASNVTLRLEQASPLPPATLFGPETLVDAPTGVPTAVPGAAPDRTEMLLAVPPTPSGRVHTDPGPTRTAVPLGDVPNLTPPPVVPAAAPPSKPRAPRLIALAALAGAALMILALVWLARGTDREATSASSERAEVRRAGAAAAALAPPAPATTVPPPTTLESAAASSSTAAPVALEAEFSSSPNPPAAPVAVGKDSKISSEASGAFLKAPVVRSPAPGVAAKPVRPAAAPAMPGSGL